MQMRAGRSVAANVLNWLPLSASLRDMAGLAAAIKPVANDHSPTSLFRYPRKTHARIDALQRESSGE